MVAQPETFKLISIMTKTYLIKTTEVLEEQGTNSRQIADLKWEEYSSLKLVNESQLTSPANVGEEVEYSFYEYESDGYYGWSGKMKGKVLFIVEE